MTDEKDQSGIRKCELCDQHPGLREDLIKATKDLEFVCTKLNRQCDTTEKLFKEVDTRLKVKPFYVLVSVLITVLIFMLGMQLSTYTSVGEMRRNLEIVKFEIKADLSKHEGETNQLIKRVDEVTSEQKILMDQVFKHVNKYPMNDDSNFNRKKR